MIHNEPSVDTPPAALTSRRCCLFEEFIVILGVVSIWRAGPPAPAPAMPKIPLNKRAPSACPYFYILADERRGNRRVKCGHFTSDCGRNFRPRARRHVHVLLAISLIHRAALCYSMPATKMQRLFSSPKHSQSPKSREHLSQSSLVLRSFASDMN